MRFVITSCSALVVSFLLQVSHLATGLVYNVTASQPLFPNQSLVSSGQVFELGFFTPNGSANQYVGIWYKNLAPSRIVWVANRERPLLSTDRSAKLVIGSDGNLKLMDGQQNLVWSTNVSSRSNYTSATLLDIGNLVLKDADHDEVWGSFEDPTDTILPRMKIGVNGKTGVKRQLVSWRSESEPSPGSFSAGITTEVPTQVFTWRGSTAYWRGGQWDQSKFIGIPDMDRSYTSGFEVQQDMESGDSYFWIETYDKEFFQYISISPGGSLQHVYWDNEAEVWLTDWLGPNNSCDVYGTCGPFGVCDSWNSPICRCLDGFAPHSAEKWNSGIWTEGCVRGEELNCHKNRSTPSSATGKEDEFVRVSQVKLPDSGQYLSFVDDDKQCRSWCRSNCTCLAYSYVGPIGCMVWTIDLIDLQEFSTAGEDLFVRVAHVKTGRSAHKIIISLSLIAGIMFFAVFVFGLCRWVAKKRGNSSKFPRPLDSVDRPERVGEASPGNAWKEQLKQEDLLELTLFSFDSILLATNNFSTTNKLGQGGFGTVYKGKLNDGKEVAVKRLSSTSAQGAEEFKNEINLLSKLRHRNLVKLLGCCCEGEEKILVYEYSSNKSLDKILFDSEKKAELDWGKRFQIIQGIARGLVYLHRDSCLRVIHRDLKVSNILLDEKMKPKISDFGLARTFEGTQVVVNTQKIVGTHGYMSPEYALGGIFSESSDVYSFGVLLLEIVSSKKNRALYDNGQHPNLISYAWQLWSDGKALDLKDEAIAVSSPLEVTRCIHVGLLCVQDRASDRPDMSNVILMLSGELDLPQPRQPTSTFRTETLNCAIPSRQEDIWSVNTLTNTMVDGR